MRGSSWVWALLALIWLSGNASAGSIEFIVVSKHDYTAQIKFYSKSRNYVWPNAQSAYRLAGSSPHTFKLKCNTGEKICWGAWDTGTPSTYWGVGANKHGCKSCCFVCGSGTANVSLANAGHITRQAIARGNGSTAGGNFGNPDPFLGQFLGTAIGIMQNSQKNSQRPNSGTQNYQLQRTPPRVGGSACTPEQRARGWSEERCTLN